MCTLPSLRSRVFVCCEQYKHARLYCWQWTHFTMGPNEQNQYFAELRQKICLYIHVVVLLTCLPSLDGKLERFVTKKWQKWLPNSSQTDYKALGRLDQQLLKYPPKHWATRSKLSCLSTVQEVTLARFEPATFVSPAKHVTTTPQLLPQMMCNVFGLNSNWIWYIPVR